MCITIISYVDVMSNPFFHILIQNNFWFNSFYPSGPSNIYIQRIWRFTLSFVFKSCYNYKKYPMRRVLRLELNRTYLVGGNPLGKQHDRLWPFLYKH